MSNVRQVAVKVLGRIEKENAFAAAVMKVELQVLTDERDAGLCTEIVLGVLRNRSWLDHLLLKASGREVLKLDPAVWNILRVAAYQLAWLSRVPDRAAVSEAVTHVGETGAITLKGLANAILRNIGRLAEEARIPEALTLETPAIQLALGSSVPLWIVSRMVADRGQESTLATLSAFNQPSRRTLRVNLHLGDIGELAEKFPGLHRRDTLLPWSLQADGRAAARQLEEDGLAAYQDEGSGLVVAALSPATGDDILDACAGRGGKTGTIAMLVGNSANITACDKKSNKLDRLNFDLGRQKLRANTQVMDLLKPFEGEMPLFDRVLLDAPCSGSGTIGRRPEIRWRLAESDVGALIDIQAKMLDAVASRVRPGGRLVFATCSVFAAEHTGHLAPFLKNHPDFHLVNTPPDIWPDLVDWNGGAPFINPGLTGTDGYGILCLTRKIC